MGEDLAELIHTSHFTSQPAGFPRPYTSTRFGPANVACAPQFELELYSFIHSLNPHTFTSSLLTTSPFTR